MILGKPIDCKLTALRANRTLHGRSVNRHQDVPGHNVFKGYLRPGTGDAADLFAPAGTQVMAMHSGRITCIKDRDGEKCVLYIEGVKNSVDVCTVYAHLHLKDELREGMNVTQGQVIGYVGRLLNDPHLHLEVWIDGHPISAKSGKEWLKKLAQTCV